MLKKKKERQDETRFTTKIDGFSFPRWMLMYFLQVFFKESHPVYGQTQGVLVLYFSYFMDNSIVLCFCFLKNIPIPIYCFSLYVSIASHYYFWVQSCIICLICLPHFLFQRFLMIMAFFYLNELKKRRKAFLEWVWVQQHMQVFTFFESVGGIFSFVGNNNDVFFVHIVVSNPKLFWSIGEGSIGRTFRFSVPPLRLPAWG
jgi:hypothetical protein